GRRRSRRRSPSSTAGSRACDAPGRRESAGNPGSRVETERPGPPPWRGRGADALKEPARSRFVRPGPDGAEPVPEVTRLLAELGGVTWGMTRATGGGGGGTTATGGDVARRPTALRGTLRGGRPSAAGGRSPRRRPAAPGRTAPPPAPPPAGRGTPTAAARAG